jgi:hypothetical protein
MPAALAGPGKPNRAFKYNFTTAQSVLESLGRASGIVPGLGTIILSDCKPEACFAALLRRMDCIHWAPHQKTCLAGPIFLGRKKPTLDMFRHPEKQKRYLWLRSPYGHIRAFEDFEYEFDC